MNPSAWVRVRGFRFSYNQLRCVAVARGCMQRDRKEPGWWLLGLDWGQWMLGICWRAFAFSGAPCSIGFPRDVS
jgi:hypothetical protein